MWLTQCITLLATVALTALVCLAILLTHNPEAIPEVIYIYIYIYTHTHTHTHTGRFNIYIQGVSKRALQPLKLV
jgi:hypothetical protein